MTSPGRELFERGVHRIPDTASRELLENSQPLFRALEKLAKVAVKYDGTHLFAPGLCYLDCANTLCVQPTADRAAWGRSRAKRSIPPPFPSSCATISVAAWTRKSWERCCTASTRTMTARSIAENFWWNLAGSVRRPPTRARRPPSIRPSPAALELTVRGARRPHRAGQGHERQARVDKETRSTEREVCKPY